MPVYNAANTVAFAIHSIIVQQFVNWELIVLDDGSTDNTSQIVSSFKDSRIRLINCNHDFISTLNRGFLEAKGEYIARMDADDLMAPERLKVQVEILNRDKKIDICSSWITFFGDGIPNSIYGSLYGKVREPILKLLEKNYFCHPTAMIRHSFWVNNNIQYREYKHAEDYELWFQMAKLGAIFYVEAQPLLYYRISNQQISNKYFLEQQKTSYEIKWEIIEYLINCHKEKDHIFQLFILQRHLVKKGIMPIDVVIQQFITIFNRLKSQNSIYIN